MRDLSDRLSPILVKELRQGVKAHLFAGALILLQILMLISVLASLALRSTQAWPAAGALFWTLVCLPLLILMPLSGVRAISGELQAKTLDLVLLTRLSATRIVLGKWWAIVVETLLLVTTILPYVVLRYFLGGIELWTELTGLGVLLLVSAFLSALMTTFSALKITAWLKWTIVVLLALVGFTQLYGLLFLWSFGMGSASLGGIEGVLWPILITFAAILLLILLETAAIAIAPPSENHATRIRLLALGAIVAGGVSVSVLSGPYMKTFVQVVAMTMVLAVCIASLCEPVKRIPTLYRPFLGRERWKRIAGAVLSPGWPAGVLFTIGACVAASLAFGWERPPSAVPGVVSLIGALMLPLAVILTLPRLFSRFRTLPVYLIILMASGLPDYLWFAGKVMNKPWVIATGESVAAFLPLSYFALGLLSPSSQIHWYAWESIVQLLVCLGAVGLVIVRLKKGWREIRKVGSEGASAEAQGGAGHEPPLATLGLADRD